MIEDVQNRFF